VKERGGGGLKKKGDQKIYPNKKNVLELRFNSITFIH
jgi:hypothetical protein